MRLQLIAVLVGFACAVGWSDVRAAGKSKPLTERSGEDVAPQVERAAGTRAASRISYYTDDDGLVVITPIVSVTQEIFDASTISAEYDADILTAATVDVRTSATDKFEEVRYGLSVGGTHRIRSWETEVSGSVSVSREADYASLTLGFGTATDFLEKNFTLGLGYSWVGNEVGRSHTSFSQFSDSLQIHALSASATQLLGKDTYFALSGSLIGAFGYQGSVYRYVPIFADGDPSIAQLDETTLLDGAARPLYRPPERVPRTRIRSAIVGRINHHFASDIFVDGNYRFYGDDWGITSHTLELKAYVKLPSNFVVRVRNRIYYQLPARFYQRAYTVDANGALPELYTLDRELGNFWYEMVGLKVGVTFPKTAFMESLELDVKADLQYTSYFDFAYLPQRTALIVGSGVVVKL